MSKPAPTEPGFHWDGMLTTYDIACPMDKILKHIKFSCIKDWPGFPLKATATGDAPGCTRSFDMGEYSLDETCVAALPNGHVYTIENGLEQWKIFPGSYRGSYTVHPNGEGACQLIYMSSFQTSDTEFSKESIGGLAPIVIACMKAIAES
eukprot:m.470043 g.470043  ORF g.470043 m.470043 type:complete len:150 (+) comp29341_c0_seq1:244-693(+)